MKFAVLGVILVWAVVTDLRSGTIRNLLTLPAMAGGVLWTGFDSEAWWDGLAGALLAIGFFYPFWFFDKFGGGDAKLMGVVGAFGGLRFAFWAIVFTLAAGAVFSLLVLLLQRRAGATLKRLGFGLLTRTLETGNLTSLEKSQRYPFALAIAAGTVLTMLALSGHWLQLPW